jgi:hypothetical protein
MKKKYVIPSIVQEFMDESVMIAVSLHNEYVQEGDEVLVKGQDAVYSTTTVEWDDWE